MSTRMKVLAAAAILVLCTGCPPIVNPLIEFTNASLSGGGCYDCAGGGGLMPTAINDISGEGERETVREVVEPDVIRRDGERLYVLNQYRGLTVVDLATQAIVAQVSTYGYPRDLYIVDNRAYVLVGYANDYKTEDNKISFSVASRLYVVDLDNLAAPAIKFNFNGDLVDSRMVGDILYAVCAEYEYYWEGTDGGVAVASPASVIKQQTSSSWVASIDTLDPNNIHQVDEVSFDGMGNIIQATNQAIFVAAADWSDTWDSVSTTITYVDITDPAGDITVRGSVKVNGSVADKFKMDAYNGVLRVVSGDWGWVNGRKVYITTFDLSNGLESLTPDPAANPKLGETILDDAIGETLFATRFDGPRAYIVTYFMVDPLFIIDLSDPANPVVAGELVVPGWSTYIEPQGNTLIALGVDDTNGRRVCVSMFDVTDPKAPAMIGNKAIFGENWAWSSAYNDVKAFTVLDDLLIVPFSGWESSNGGYDRLQFISYSPAGLEARGYVDVSGQVLRSFEYNGLYYGVTTEQLATINATDLSNPVVANQLTLAEYVADFLELTPDVGVEIVSEYNSGKTFVRTVGLGEKSLGSVEVNIGSLQKILPYGQSVVLIGTNWDEVTYESFYVVAMVDCSDPSAPVISREGVVKVDPYWDYYWYGRGGMYMAEMAVAKQAEMAIAPGYRYMPWTPGETVFLLGDTLVLRCYHDAYDTVIGEATPYQGLALLNLTSGDGAYTTVGLGYDYLVSLNAAGSKLYIGTQKNATLTGILPTFYPVVANYVIEFNPATATVGPTVNVPGTFVQYDSVYNVLTVRDDQWSTAGNIESTLRTFSWNGGEILLTLDDVRLPAGTSTLLGRGSKIFIDAYDSGYKLYALSVKHNGNLELSDGVLVTDQWASLLEAHGNTAYIPIGNAIACYDFSGPGKLKDLFLTMGYPLSVHFGTDHAYMALGYSGIAELPLWGK